MILAPNRTAYDSPKNDIHFKLSFPEATENIDPTSLTAKVRILGLEKYLIRPVSFDGSKITSNLLPSFNKDDNFSNTFPFVRRDGNNFSIPSGSYFIPRDLVIPTNCSLTIDEGTTLRFAKNAVLYLEGALFVNGTKENQVFFKAENVSWGGMLITNSSERSKINFLNCEHANGIGPFSQNEGLDRNGWMLTGSVTFHRSDVDLLNSTFKNINSEDALNLVSSNFTLLGCKFSKVKSDAFDGDFVTGEMQDCHFHDISGDGVDFSGSNAVVSNCFFTNIADKAISVGEGSRIKVSNAKIKNASFGVVSKDMSVTEVFDKTEIINSTKAAFAAFQRKCFWSSKYQNCGFGN